jgi:hypothetical protein
MAAQLAAEFPATNAGWTATIDRFAFHREMRRLVEGRAQGLRVLETFRKPGISIGGIDILTACTNHRMRLRILSISISAQAILARRPSTAADGPDRHTRHGHRHPERERDRRVFHAVRSAWTETTRQTC